MSLGDIPSASLLSAALQAPSLQVASTSVVPTAPFIVCDVTAPLAEKPLILSGCPVLLRKIIEKIVGLNKDMILLIVYQISCGRRLLYL